VHAPKIQARVFSAGLQAPLAAATCATFWETLKKTKRDAKSTENYES
jgi:hypothetical protein